MLNFEEKITDQFYSSIEELLMKLQKAQEHLRQATMYTEINSRE